MTKPTYEELQRERDELVAHVERLREFIEDWYDMDGCTLNHVLDDMLAETPSQSLNHIEAQVEEETIARLENKFGRWLRSVTWETIKDEPRKYAKQEPEAVTAEKKPAKPGTAPTVQEGE